MNPESMLKNPGIVGTFLNLVGTILVIIAIGDIPCTSSTTCGDVTYKIAYIVHPLLLKIGLISIVFGFSLILYKKIGEKSGNKQPTKKLGEIE